MNGEHHRDSLEARLAGLVELPYGMRSWADVTQRARRKRKARAAATVVTVFAVIAAMALGGYSVLQRLGDEQAFLVIGDPATGQTLTAETSTSLSENDFGGLWTGNVQTIPEHPSSLPQAFFEPPSQETELLVGQPLWIFTQEVPTNEAALAVEGAPPERAIVIFDPTEELCERLDIPARVRPSSLGELPDMFTQRPILVREQVFVEVDPLWSLTWATLGSLSDGSLKTDPEAVYQQAVALTMRIEERKTRIGERKTQSVQGDSQDEAVAAGDGDVYPIPRTVETKEAEGLAQKVLLKLQSMIPQALEIRDAVESQMVGPNEVLEHRAHLVSIREPSTGKWINVYVFCSDQDQMGHATSAEVGGGGAPWTTFVADDGSKGVLSATFGYDTRVQLDSGLTISVSAGSKTNAPRLPAEEASLLSPEQMVELTLWLATEADYLVPPNS